MSRTIHFFCRTMEQIIASYLLLRNRYKLVTFNWFKTNGPFVKGFFTCERQIKTK